MALHHRPKAHPATEEGMGHTTRHHQEDTDNLQGHPHHRGHNPTRVMGESRHQTRRAPTHILVITTSHILQGILVMGACRLQPVLHMVGECLRPLYHHNPHHHLRQGQFTEAGHLPLITQPPPCPPCLRHQIRPTRSGTNSGMICMVTP